jgi:arsenate reductase
VLFLCTGNSARSIMAEALLNDCGGVRFRGYSAGSHPKGEVHPLTLDLLRSFGLPVEGLRSKSWDEFARPESPKLDLVVTVCDQAAGEICPVWPGRPLRAHWSIPDPAVAQGDEAARKDAFREAFRKLEKRVRLLVTLDRESLDEASLKMIFP